MHNRIRDWMKEEDVVVYKQNTVQEGKIVDLLYGS